MLALVHRIVALALLLASLGFSAAGAWVVHDGRVLEGLLLLFAGIAFLHGGVEIARLARTMDLRET